jgi:ribosome-interacting GTPase 1
MMPFEDIQVQLVDLPAVAPGATPAWLRGLLHGADLLLLLVDLDTDPTTELQSVESELAALHVVARPPGRPPADDETTKSRPALVIGTRADLPAADDGAELLRLDLQDRLPLLLTSTASSSGLDTLRQRIVDALAVVRVYAKPPGRPPDLNRPFVLARGSTVEDLADTVHHELRHKLLYAVRWHADRPPVRVAHDYELHDRDIIELHAG